MLSTKISGEYALIQFFKHTFFLQFQTNLIYTQYNIAFSASYKRDLLQNQLESKMWELLLGMVEVKIAFDFLLKIPGGCKVTGNI